LDVPRILVLRRMTLSDPESLKWATPQQLDVVFNVILSELISSKSYEGLEAVAENQYEAWLPPGPPDVRDQDRWLLHDLCKPMLPEKPTVSFAPPAPPPLVKVEDLLADEEEENVPFTGFNALLDNTVLKVLRSNLKVLAVHKSIRPHMPLPFFCAPSFAEILLPTVKELILPSLHGSRLLKDLSTSRDWSKPGEDARLMGILQGGEARQNPILHQWDARWDHFSDASQAQLRTKGKDDPPEKTPWPRLVPHGAKNDYISADERHIWILKSMLRWEPETIAEGWEQLSQMYIQEFNPPSKHEQAREGSVRDGIVKWIEKIHRHGGEALAMKAFYELPKCDKMYMHKLTQTFGMEAQRKAAVPLLIEMLESLPK
jgi:hypothetical protein